MISRRSFLQQTALVGAGLAFAPSLLKAGEVKKIGIQLYTLRDFIGKDVKGVLKQVASSGYSYVETYGYSKKGGFWGLTPGDFKSLLKNCGLETPSGHYGMEQFISTDKDDELKSYIEAANITGQEYITVPWLPESLRKTADDYKKIAEKLNKAGEICKKADLKLAYHNHDFEFKTLDNGEVGYDILLRSTEAKLVKLELDLYWAVRAGYDPIALFKSNPYRFVMWHVKDMDKLNQKLNTEVGNGSIDFATIFNNQRPSGVKYIFMEQENNYVPDAFGSIKQSSKYIEDKLIRRS